MSSIGSSVPLDRPVVFRESPAGWALLALGLALLIALFHDGLNWMVGQWNSSEEYGYGYLIPVISLFLIWQRKDQLERLRLPGSWAGVVVLLLGLAMFFLGHLSTLYIIMQYGFVVALFGLAWAYTGWEGMRRLAVPIAFLLFMIPLPGFIYQGLSTQLQLVSSELGVALIRLFDISVHLEGNVIDLGSYKLQVVEACSGLRYLFPLASLAFISAYFFQGALWKKIIIVLSAVPITVLMNSFRIGMIGVLVEFWGQDMAEGFLHDFEGWVVFMACMVVLLAEMWLLAKIGPRRLPFAQAFGIDLPNPTPRNAEVHRRPVGKPAVTAGALIVLSLAGALALQARPEIIPARADFAAFPMQLGDWRGEPEVMEQMYIDTLKFEDYLLADYRAPGEQPVNLYLAYYESQRAGESAHSPRSCIPGGGWEITDLRQVSLTDVAVSGNPLAVNRVVIQNGDIRQLVYYWFQQRDRILTNEYLVKWYLFWDALTRQRTDGALVRLTAFLRPHEDLAEADARLTRFVRLVSEPLPAYVPD